MSTTTNGFLPDNYEPPKAQGGYLKFKDGSTKFRILTSPVIGWEGWNNEDRPVRFKAEPTKEQEALLRVPKYGNKKVKHFWAMVVYSYADAQVMILQITQANIITGITALAKDEAWGNPREYDITVNKTGTGTDTKYTVVPNPPKPLAEEVVAEVMDMEGKIELEALFTGDNPFKD